MRNSCIKGEAKFLIACIIGFVIILLIAVGIEMAWSATYYVNANSGSNSNDGLSLSQAFLSLGKACSTVSAGDTVWAIGTFNESTPVYGQGAEPHGTLSPHVSGTATNKIYWGCWQDSGRAVLEGNADGSRANYGIVIGNDITHNIFDSFEVRQTYRAAIRFYRADYNEFRNLLVHNWSDNDNCTVGGFDATNPDNQDGCWGLRIIKCEIYGDGASSGVNSGAIFSYGDHGMVVESCYIHDLPDYTYGIRLKSGADQCTLRYNTITGAYDGIVYSVGCDSNIAYGNTIYGPFQGGGHAFYINSNHPTYPHSHNCKFYNNTIYLASGGTPDDIVSIGYYTGNLWEDSVKDFHCFNNIIYSTVASNELLNVRNSPIMFVEYLDYNCYFNGSVGSDIVNYERDSQCVDQSNYAARWDTSISTYTDTVDLKQIMTDDNDGFIIGHSTTFLGLQIGMSQVASSDVDEQYQFWNGSGWTNFNPSRDLTSGFTTDDQGAEWSISTLTGAGWVSGDPGGDVCATGYYIRVFRQADVLTTPPTMDTVAIILSNEYYTLTEHQNAQNFDLNSIDGNPYFNDAANGDFTLSDSSPCRTSGRGGSWPSYMGAFDPGEAPAPSEPDTILNLKGTFQGLHIKKP